MSGQAERLEEALVVLVVQGATGVLEVAEEPKRWQFFLDHGDLISTRSNLKSETEEVLRKELPSANEPELLQVQASRRLTNACRGLPTWSFKPSVAPARRVNLHVRRALFEAVRDTRDAAELQRRLAPVLRGWPVSLDPEAEVTATSLDAYLAALDGSRPGEDIVTFAPAEPSVVLAAVWLAWRLGLVDDGDGQRGPTFQIEPSREPVPLEHATTDISALVGAHEASLPSRGPAPIEPPRVTPARAAPQAPAAPPTPPPASPRAAPREAPPPSGPATNPPKTEPTSGPAARLKELEGQIRGAANHFAALGMSHEASPNDLRAAYMRLARDLHPDRYSGAPSEVQELATDLFDRIRAAWEELGDEGKRLTYIDRVIHGKKSEDELAMEAVQRYLSAENDFKRGMAAFNAGQTVASLPHFQSAAEKAPEETEFRGFYGYALFFARLRSEPEKAIEGFRILEQAIADNNNQERKRDSLHVLLARAWRERGDAQLARRAAVAALKINANNADAARLIRRLQDEEATAAQKAESGVMGKVQGMLGGLFKKKS